MSREFAWVLEAFWLQAIDEVQRDESPRKMFKINLRLASEPKHSDVSLFFAWRQDMLTKYALVAIIVLCITALGFTLMVRDSLCELSIRERGMEFKAILAYEPKK
jgi:protein HokE